MVNNQIQSRVSEIALDFIAVHNLHSIALRTSESLKAKTLSIYCINCQQSVVFMYEKCKVGAL